MLVSAITERKDIEDFLYYEARLLDEQRLDDWVRLFEPHGYYWVPMAWEQPDPLNHVSLYYEGPDLLRLRAQRLQHERTVSQWPPSRTCHQISNIEFQACDNGLLLVHSALVFFEYRRDEQLCFAGRVEHSLVQHKDSFRIVLKRVNLLNCDSDAGHLRMAIPF